MKNKKTETVGLTGNAANPKKQTRLQEKTSVGGHYNSGVTSDNEEEKKEIERKGSLMERQPASDNEKKNNAHETK
jgi:hypothetical protein